MALCSNCGKKPVVHDERCERCYRYKLVHGYDRPLRIVYREKFCTNCKSFFRGTSEQCSACRRYKARTGKARPAYLWNVELRCKTCKRPLAQCGRRLDRCPACYRYWNEHGVDRPRHLWGIDEHGWCDCGWPAIVTIHSMNLCNSCAELEMSE